MIIIKRKPGEYDLTVEGHAKGASNERGYDLVCCAVSTLMYAFLYSSGSKAQHDIRDGYMHVKFERAADTDGLLQKRFDFLMDGLDMLAKAYPTCSQMDL